MRLLIVLFVVFLILPGCQKEESVLNSHGGELFKEFSISGYADGFTTFPLGTAAPHRHMEGTGQSTPGGNVQIIMDYLVTSFTPPNGTSGFGSGELITANGDKMFAINGEGTFSISGTTVTFSTTTVIAGGTGDYDNVKGVLNYSGTLDQLTGATHVEWTGTFSRKRPFGGSFTAENVTVTGSCLPGYTRRHAEGTANAIHFGKSHGTVEHCINFTTGIMVDGNGSFVSANGDKIFVSYNGYAVPVPGTNTAAVNMFCTITGGEGKFQNASGYIWAKALQTLPEGTVEATMDGVIDY